jgi:TolB protein
MNTTASAPSKESMRKITSPLLLSAALLLLVASAFPVLSQGTRAEDPDLPTSGVVIDIDAPDRALYKIAVPNLRGSDALGPQAASVIRNDLHLSSLFELLDTGRFRGNLDQEGLNIRRGPWQALGAQAVIKGEIRENGDALEVEMRLYELAEGDSPVFTEIYRGGAGEVRGFMHAFDNEVLRHLFGEPGHFDTQITYARRVAPGRKDVYLSDYDGFNNHRVSLGRGVAMLPSFGENRVWYSRLTQLGMFITNTGSDEQPVINGDGLTMSPTLCNGRVYFTSTRDGNSEIYSAGRDGSNVRRLTQHPAIDVSPSCGPNGQLAFVSNRHGSPQVWVMNADGSEPRRVTFRGSHNQTPAWCPDPNRPLIAFTGRANGLDIFTVNVQTQSYVRVTQGNGANKDPAFSPDCRMLAYSSTRQGGGVYVSSPFGFNTNRVIEGAAETIRWSR